MSKVAMDQTMKQKIETLIECIRLSGAGARGTLLSDCNVPWMEVIQTASAQKVLPLVSCAVIDNPDLSCPDPIKDSKFAAIIIGGKCHKATASYSIA